MSGEGQLPMLSLDEFNRECFIRFSSAYDTAALAGMVRAAARHPLWNGKVAKHACQMLILLEGGRS